jgi:hypothetical protein
VVSRKFANVFGGSDGREVRGLCAFDGKSFVVEFESGFEIEGRLAAPMNCFYESPLALPP